MISPQDDLSVVTPYTGTLTVYYDDLGDNMLGYTRVLEPAPRLLVINSRLRGTEREQAVRERLLAMRQPEPRTLAEALSPPPMVLRGRVAGPPSAVRWLRALKRTRRGGGGGGQLAR